MSLNTGKESTSSYLYKINCDACGSSDALGVYDDGHQFCYSCNTFFPPEKSGGEGNAARPAPVPNQGQTQQKALLEGSPKAITARGLTLETCKKFGYLTGHRNGEDVQMAVYRDKGGKPIAQKVRNRNKQFQMIGDAKSVTLYGSHLWNNGKKLVICEGELDAMSVSQIQNHRWPTVSLSQGAAGAVRNLKANWDYLMGFEEIILMFDMDEVGQKAAIACAELLPVGQAKIAYLPCKDANECLMQGKSAEVIQAIFQAKTYRPDGIVAATDYRDAICVDEAASSISYPYSALDHILKGMRKQELVTVCAGSGVGKTTFVRELVYHLHQAGQRVGCIMLEEANKRTILGLVGMHLNKNLTVDRSQATDEEVLAGFDSLFSADGRNPVYLYDHFGSTDVDVICQRIVYMAKALEVDWIVLDHLAILISQTAIGTDERKLVDYAMTKLRTLVQEHSIGCILVQHLRRPDGNRGHEGGQEVRLSDLRSSHSVAQLSDACIALNVDPDDPHNDVRHLRILKNRYTGETGDAGTLVYDRTTGRLLEEELNLLLTPENDNQDAPAEQLGVPEYDNAQLTGDAA
jgi:twinkle protein